MSARASCITTFRFLAILALPLSALGFLAFTGLRRPRTVGQNTPAERRFEFQYTVHVPALPPGSRVLRLWIPLPRTGAHQHIQDLHLATPIAYRTYTSRQFGNQFAYLRIVAARARRPFDVGVTFRAVRYEYDVALPSKDPAPNATPFPPAIARYLLPDRLIPIDGIIGRLSREQTRGIRDPLAKARRIYDYVLDTMHYDHNGTGWGHGNAIYACTAHHGNCTDFHSLFIGMARAAGIPARFEIGFYLPPGQAEGKLGSYHCWAEFYVQGIGWIPIDAAEAWLQPARRSFYFGALDPDRVRFTRGRDLVLTPRQAAPPLNYFVYPYAELDGKPFTGLGYEFSFRDLPSAPAAPRAAVASSDPRTAGRAKRKGSSKNSEKGAIR